MAFQQLMIAPLLLQLVLYQLLLLHNLVDEALELGPWHVIKDAEDIEMGVPVEKQRKESKCDHIDHWQHQIAHVEVLLQEADSPDVQGVDVLPGLRHVVVVFMVLDEAQMSFAGFLL